MNYNNDYVPLRKRPSAFGALDCPNEYEEQDDTPDTASDSVLLEAQRIVHGRRQEDYGNPKDNHNRTALMWVAYMEGKYDMYCPFTPEDVCFLNALQKISRQMNAPKRDNLVDICGYMANIEMINDAEEDVRL